MTIAPRPVDGVDGAALRSLLEQSASLPADHMRMDRGLVLDHAVALTRGLAEAAADRWILEEDGALSGLAMLQPLAWDSERLGMAAGRSFVVVARGTREAEVDRARRLVRAVERATKERALDHVSVRLDVRELPAIQAFEGAGYRLVDGIQKFVFDAREQPVPAVDEDAVRLRDARTEDVADLRRLAAGGFARDRFHDDPAIPSETADALYAAWIENAALGKTGSGLMVAEIEGSVAGFMLVSEDSLARDTLHEEVGTLVLMTVDPAFRRRGVARALTWGSMSRLAERGNRFIEVGTQIDNQAASTLYFDTGFRLARTWLSLRWWNGDAG